MRTRHMPANVKRVDGPWLRDMRIQLKLTPAEKALRKSKGIDLDAPLTQSELAARIGYKGYHIISMYENDRQRIPPMVVSVVCMMQQRDRRRA